MRIVRDGERGGLKRDGQIWRVPVKVCINQDLTYKYSNVTLQRGQEAEVISSLERQKEYLMEKGYPSLVYSAFIAPLTPSAIYVRAASKDAILHACQQISSARANNQNITLIPEEEHLVLKLKKFLPVTGFNCNAKVH